MNENTKESSQPQPPLTYQEESLRYAEEQMRMASERTYLSWVRTGLTSVGIGIAIAKFILFRSAFNQTTGRWIGQLLILWGMGIFIFALLSYKKSFQNLRFLKKEKHPLAPLIVITAILVFIALTLFVIVLE
jgi:putative membrane protein